LKDITLHTLHNKPWTKMNPKRNWKFIFIFSVRGGGMLDESQKELKGYILAYYFIGCLLWMNPKRNWKEILKAVQNP